MEEWTIDLNRKKVSRGGLEHPDMYLEMDEADFLNMLVNELDVEEAALAGRVRFEGDPQLLVDLGDLFQEAKPDWCLVSLEPFNFYDETGE